MLAKALEMCPELSKKPPEMQTGPDDVLAVFGIPLLEFLDVVYEYVPQTSHR